MAGPKLEIPEASLSLSLGDYSATIGKGIKKEKKEGKLTEKEAKALAAQALEVYKATHPQSAPKVDRWQQRGQNLNRMPRGFTPGQKADGGSAGMGMLLITFAAGAAIGAALKS